MPPPSAARPVVRPVRPEEHEQVGRLILDAYDAVGRITGPYREALRDTGRRVAEGALVLVAVDPETDVVLGSVTYADAGDPHFEGPQFEGQGGDATFRMLAVDVAAQGRGTGRALVDACLAIARERDRRRIAIYSMEWMPAAHALYQSMGFTRRPDLDVAFPAGVGYAFQLDLVDDAAAAFPPPGPVPATPPWYEDAWAAHQPAADGEDRPAAR